MGTKIDFIPGIAGESCNRINVRGELDLLTVSVFTHALDQAAGGQAGGVIVDLGECGFIDSTGVSLLLNATRRQTREREGFAVVCPNPTPLRVFEITGTIDTLNVVSDYASAEEAVVKTREALQGAGSEDGDRPAP